MSDKLERQIADMLADGRMTDADAEHVREFANFLEVAGPPITRDANGTPIPSPDGKSMIQRAIEAGRLDLISYALPGVNGEQAFWEANRDDANVYGDPPYNVVEVGVKILNAIDPLRMLDLGCGAGRLTNMMARRVIGEGVVHGVDISSTLVMRAVKDAYQRDLGNAHYWHGNGRHLPSGLKGKFSGAYSVSMFQHIPHDAMWGYLREVHDRLESGGVFLFTIAVGEVDEFLNHQIADTSRFGHDLAEVYDSVSIQTSGDPNGWVWVTARKAMA